MSKGKEKTRKCAHIPCRCRIAEGKEYCSEACELAGKGEVEVACECGHTACK